MMMKRVLTVVTLFSSTAIFAQAQNCKPQPGDAKVEKEKGVYIFVSSMPSAPYTVIGTVKAGSGAGKILGGSAEYTEKKNRLLNNALKEYPETEGLIVYFNSLEADRAESIKFTKASPNAKKEEPAKATKKK